MIRQKANFMAHLGQPKISIVLPEQKPIFSSRCEHPIRLRRSLGNQIINQNSDVCLVAPNDNGIQSFGSAGGVDSSHESLGTSLFVSRRAINLACQEQIAAYFCFECGVQLGWIGEVVFDGIGWPQNFGVLAADDCANEFELHIKWQAG